jgi:pimeloyl-ACP methyl ester carboxylesterase
MQGGAVKEYSETHTLPLPAEDVLACPITVMWGEHDVVSNPKFGKRWWRDWDGYSHHKVRGIVRRKQAQNQVEGTGCGGWGRGTARSA